MPALTGEAAAAAATGDIVAFAGSVVPGPAVPTSISQAVNGVAVGAAGTEVYVSAGSVVRKIDASGETVFAGTGFTGFSGDGGDAKAAQLNGTLGLVLDGAGNLYIADSSNHRIRKVDAGTGVISTVVGTGTAGSLGDGGAATAAELRSPQGLGVDAAGNLYVADNLNHRIRRVDAGTGVITTVAGLGTPGSTGDSGPAIAAQLNSPKGVAVDASGNLFIADSSNHRIRKVDAATGLISTVAGTGAAGPLGDGGAATAAQLNSPFDVKVVGSDVYIADRSNHRIRKVDSTNTITAVAGTGVFGFSGDCPPSPCAATAAQLNSPFAVAFDGTGVLYVADNGNFRLRRIDTSGEISTLAGNGTAGTSTNGTPGYSGEGGDAELNQLSNPTGVQLAGGFLYLADRSNHRVRRIDTATRAITTVAGSGTSGFAGDGGSATSSLARLNNPQGVAIDGSTVYIADSSNNRIRVVDASGTLSTLAGTGTSCATTNVCGDGGPATAAQLNPFGLSVGGGYLYVADFAANRVRRVELATGTISTCAGTGTRGYSGDAGPAGSALLANPIGVTVAGATLYVAEQGNNVIRRVDLSTGGCGTISTAAGTGGVSGFAGDGGPATAARLTSPFAVAASAGNLYISDQGNHRIRKVDSAGTISTVAGTGTAGFAGNNGPATAALLNAPRGVAADATNLYVADTTNHRIRKVLLPSPTATSLSSSANPSVEGAAVTFTAAVTATQPGTPTGTVAFSDGTTALGMAALDSAGTASLTTSTLSVGSHAITATYAGDPNFAPSTSSVLTQTVQLAPPAATLSPTSIAFGDQTVGSASAPSSVKVTNSGGSDLHVSSASLTGADPTAFTVTSDTCTGATVAAGASCAVAVSFAPTAAGARSASLALADDAADSPQSVALSGNGLAVPTIAISDLTITEGNAGTAPAGFTVSLSGPSTEAVSVQYATADGGAKAGSDYVAASGTVSFAPGETAQTVAVDVIGDSVYELNEKFFVDLGAATGANVADARGKAVIVNDDAKPTLSISDVSQVEGGAGVTTKFSFTVSLSAASGLPTTLGFATAAATPGSATAGSDFTAKSGTLTIPAGVTTAIVKVAVVGDALVEPDEIFLVRLSNPTNAVLADAKGVATILNDD